MSTDKRDPKHKLLIWMRDHALTDEAMGRKLVSEDRPNGVAKRTVFRWLTEGRIPELDLVQQIYDLTDGYVGMMDWNTAYLVRKKAALAKVRRKPSPAKTATAKIAAAKRRAAAKPKSTNTSKGNAK